MDKKSCLTSDPPKQKERPLIFKAEMVRAILEGRKTQTRRGIKFQVSPPEGYMQWDCPEHGNRRDYWCIAAKNGYEEYPQTHALITCPYGQPGDLLWVRETWGLGSENNINHVSDEQVFYRATDPGWDENETGFRWKPSIHMPRWASRLTLEITKIRVERLQEISEADAKAEGVACPKCKDKGTYLERFADNHLTVCQDCVKRAEVAGHTIRRGQFVTTDTRKTFARLWDSINGVGTWERNPWVWVLEFGVIR